MSFGFFVISVLSATATEFAEFEALGRRLLILGRHIVPTLAYPTLEHNIIARHKLPRLIVKL